MSKVYDSQKALQEHSKAKVELYEKYLAVYLSLLTHVRYINRIYIFDLFCGEGAYEGGEQGSALSALRVIKDLYWTYRETCPNISVWFNDNGVSQIEDGTPKINRVERLCRDKYGVPDTEPFDSKVKVRFFDEDYIDICRVALKQLEAETNAKGLFFLDPYGYKYTPPDNIREIMEAGNTEVILFLPASQMYRFIKPALETEVSGTEPLKEFLGDLFGDAVPHFESVLEFIEGVKERYRSYLYGLEIFIDSFILERDNQNTYCLLFFTTHIKGALKMLETKWSLDKEQGRGFRYGDSGTPSLFQRTETTGYHEKLRAFIKEAEYRTNDDLFRFGLKNGFLPKHTNQILKDWKKRIEGFEVFSLDGKEVRGNYIGNADRKVGFKFRGS